MSKHLICNNFQAFLMLNHQRDGLPEPLVRIEQVLLSSPDTDASRDKILAELKALFPLYKGPGSGKENRKLIPGLAISRQSLHKLPVDGLRGADITFEPIKSILAKQYLLAPLDELIRSIDLSVETAHGLHLLEVLRSGELNTDAKKAEILGAIQRSFPLSPANADSFVPRLKITYGQLHQIQPHHLAGAAPNLNPLKVVAQTKLMHYRLQRFIPSMLMPAERQKKEALLTALTAAYPNTAIFRQNLLTHLTALYPQQGEDQHLDHLGLTVAELHNLTPADLGDMRFRYDDLCTIAVIKLINENLLPAIKRFDWHRATAAQKSAMNGLIRQLAADNKDYLVWQKGVYYAIDRLARTESRVELGFDPSALNRINKGAYLQQVDFKTLRDIALNKRQIAMLTRFEKGSSGDRAVLINALALVQVEHVQTHNAIAQVNVLLVHDRGSAKKADDLESDLLALFPTLQIKVIKQFQPAAARSTPSFLLRAGAESRSFTEVMAQATVFVLPGWVHTYNDDDFRAIDACLRNGSPLIAISNAGQPANRLGFKGAGAAASVRPLVIVDTGVRDDLGLLAQFPVYDQQTLQAGQAQFLEYISRAEPDLAKRIESTPGRLKVPGLATAYVGEQPKPITRRAEAELETAFRKFVQDASAAKVEPIMVLIAIPDLRQAVQHSPELRKLHTLCFKHKIRVIGIGKLNRPNAFIAGMSTGCLAVSTGESSVLELGRQGIHQVYAEPLHLMGLGDQLRAAGLYHGDPAILADNIRSASAIRGRPMRDYLGRAIYHRELNPPGIICGNGHLEFAIPGRIERSVMDLGMMMLRSSRNPARESTAIDGLAATFSHTSREAREMYMLALFSVVQEHNLRYQYSDIQDKLYRAGLQAGGAPLPVAAERAKEMAAVLRR